MESSPDVEHGVLAPLTKVTRVSKYLALVLFVVLPFVGARIGYQLGLEKTTEVAEPVTVSVIQIDTPATSLPEMQRTFHAQISDRYDISPLYTNGSNSVQYFTSFIAQSSSCCGIYKYLPETASFYNTGIGIDRVVGEKESPDGRYVVNVDEGITVQVYDLETQSLAQEASVVSALETLIAETCGYAGYSYNLQWIDQTTLQYGVYKKVTDYSNCPVMELVEYRTIQLR